MATKKPDFIRCHCATTDRPSCATCPKDFAITTDAIEGVFRGSSGKCDIGLLSPLHPRCPDHYRFFEVNKTFEEMMTILDGEILDLGDVTVIDKSKI